MPLARAARCRRSTRRQATPTAPQVQAQAHIQVAAGLLDPAIASQQRRSIAFCRCLSSQKGAIETRRRLLGKRHMTGIMANPVTYRPLWHFEVINNPTEWSWEPPTTPEARQRNGARISLKNLTGRLLRWLEDSDLDKPFLDPPEVLDAASAEQSGTASSTTVPISTGKELLQLRAAICEMDQVAKTDLWSVRDEFVRHLVGRIKAGDITVEDLVDSMSPLDRATIAHIGNNGLARSFASKVQRAIITTISALRAADIQDDYREAWMAVMNHALSTGKDGISFQTMALLIEKAQPADRSLISADQLATRLYDLVYSMVRLHKRRITLEDVAHFAQVMRFLDPAIRDRVSQEVENTVNGAFAAGRSQEYRYWWVVFKAHCANVSSSEFERDLDSYLGCRSRPNDHQSLLLIAARMFALDSLDAKSYMALARQLRADYQEKHWLTLAKKVVDSRGHDGLMSLWCHLRGFKHDRRFYRTLLAYSRGRRARGEALAVIKAIVSNPRLPSLGFWRALEAERDEMLSARTRDLGDHLAADVDGDVDAHQAHLMHLVDCMARWYETEETLTNRMAFRGLSRCVRFQTQLSGQPSEQVLASMTKVAIAKLQQGEPTSSARLQHYINDIVAPNQGAEAAQSLERVLVSWRNHVQIRAEGRRTCVRSRPVITT